MVKFTVDLIIEEDVGKPYGEGFFTLTWFEENKHEFEIVEMICDVSKNKNDVRTLLRLRRRNA